MTEATTAPQQTAETLSQAGKLRVADAARLLAENNKTLDMTRRADERSRALHASVEEAIAQEKYGVAPPESASKPGDDEVNILIDSPTTTHHHAAPAAKAPAIEPPPAIPSGGRILRTIAFGALMTAGGAGIATLVPWIASKVDKPPVVAPAEKPAADVDTRYDLRLGED